MNFNQLPGFYDAKTDKIIKTFNEALKDVNIRAFKGDENIYVLGCSDFINEPFYVILPEDIDMIHLSCFRNRKNLVGISGKNVKEIREESFANCENLEEVDFPKLSTLYHNTFENCEKLKEKCTKTNDLVLLNGKWLITAKNNINEEITIPGEVTAIVENAFEDNKNLKKIVLPVALGKCTLNLPKSVNELVYPVKFDEIHVNTENKALLIFFKGTMAQYKKKIKECATAFGDKEVSICIDPFTKEELNSGNYSVKDIEVILDKKLTLDEILSYGKTMKEANNYFKEKEEER